MGQYYRMVTRDRFGVIEVCDRETNGGGYTCAKLMEFSWLGERFVDALAYKLYSEIPVRIAFVGDYADEVNSFGEDDVEQATKGEVLYEDVWVEHPHRQIRLDYHGPFDYKGKFLVNHSKKVYVSFDEYMKECTRNSGCIFPVSLLTAVGNGRGDGDFYADYVGAEFVGSWTWDWIDIRDEEPVGMEKVDIRFVEEKEAE